jgi:hypothetical protein
MLGDQRRVGCLLARRAEVVVRETVGQRPGIDVDQPATRSGSWSATPVTTRPA